MKKIIVCLYLLLCCGYIVAQNCVRNIRTKWDSAQNTELTTLYPTKTNPWVNTFNVGTNNGIAFNSIQLAPNANWNSGVSMLMQNPFSPGGPSEYSYLYEPIGGSVHDMDYHWEDGWEVMWLNLGRYPNGERIDSLNINRVVQGPDAPANSRVPYIIMYNRYTGKLRAFANLVTGFNAYHNARLQFFHPGTNQASGLFRHLSNYDQALDQRTTVRRAASANQSNLNNNNTWMSSDFQLGYDPCICNYHSNIEFKLATVKSYDVDLLGRSVSLNMPVSAIDSPAYSNFLTNEGLREGLDNGSVIYKSFGKMLDDYDAELAAYNTRLKSYNSPVNQGLRTIIAAGKTGVENAGGTWILNNFGDLALRTLVALDGASKQDTSNANKAAEAVSSNVKGQLGKGFDFLSISAFGKSFFEAPQRPSMPTATFSEMKIAGTIVDSAEVFVASFLTPGSYKYPQVLTAFNYPAYNEVPGLFALLQTPQLNFYENRFNQKTFLSFDTLAVTVVSDSPKIFQIDEEKLELWQQKHKFYYRLQNPLKYKLNRALDFDNDNTKLYVSLVVELENGMPDTLNCFKSNITNHSKNMYLRDVFPAIDGHAWQAIFESPWQPMETAGETLFDLDFTNTFVANYLRTNVRIIDSNGISHVSIGDWDECSNEEGPIYHIKRVKLKVAADMYFKQKGKNGIQNNTFQEFTHLLYDEAAGVNRTSQLYEIEDLTRKKKSFVSLTNETIESTDSFVFETIGNKIYVNADSIHLNGTITVASGFEAVLQATSIVRGVSGTTTIGRDIHLRRVSGFSPFGNITETSQTELDAFCQNTSDGYKANRALSKWGEPDPVVDETEQEKQPKTFVYPNPASEQFHVQVSLDEQKEYTFTVVDLMGRTLINETVAGNNQPVFEITTERLVSGTYFLVIKTADGTLNETHRIVVLK